MKGEKNDLSKRWKETVFRVRPAGLDSSPPLSWVTLGRSFTLNLSFHICEGRIIRPMLRGLRRICDTWRALMAPPCQDAVSGCHGLLLQALKGGSSAQHLLPAALWHSGDPTFCTGECL